ncbi:MAG: aldehyde ferredoxin oxidoreductase family protein [Candidatus Heimdallarchaeota archaeon]
MANGFFGKILWIDLTKESYLEQNLPEKLYRNFIGGYGLGCKLIYDNMNPNLDPFDLDSIIGFFPGLLTGTTAPYSGRYMVVGKSPLTNTWGDANGGGNFGPAIKKCGYDGILISGTGNNPKYVAIVDEKIEIIDASDIWGLDIIDTEKKLKQKHGKFIKTATIGRAGEKLSKISGIANDRGRIAARSGLGATMGSKKLKALVLKGNKNINFNNKNEFINLVKDYNHRAEIKEPGLFMNFILYKLPNMAKIIRRMRVRMTAPPNIMRHVYKNLGTSAGNTVSAENGDMPIKNWSGIGMYDFPFEKTKALSVLDILKYKVRDYGCFSCPVQCGAILKIPELNIEEMHTPEYETCAAFGPFILNNDLSSIFEINNICNRAAIDTISTGVTTAFAIECFEEGILTKNDTDGLELTWGNSKAVIELVKKIINRDGIGDILADGSSIAAKKIGNGSEKFAMTSFGSEIPMHNPRMFKSLAFTYAYDPTPGRHTSASIDHMNIGDIDNFVKGFKMPHSWKRNVKKKQLGQKMVTGIHQIISCGGLCMFTPLFGTYPLLELINALTGWDMNVEECINTGIRIQTLRQAFNLREGINLTENELPGRVIGDPPDEKGPNKGINVEYKEFYKGYCEKMGWNPENGYPLLKTLEDLELDFIIKDLY